MPASAPERGEFLSQTPDFYLNGGGCETFPRRFANTAGTIVSATGIMTSYAITLYQGDVISTLAFRAGTTSAVAPTNWWLALYDGNQTPALLGQTADQLTTAVSAGNFAVPLVTPVPITRSGLYYVSMMFAAGTVPTVCGFNATTGGMTGASVGPLRQIVYSSGSSLTGTAPPTITGTTTLIGTAWMAAY